MSEIVVGLNRRPKWLHGRGFKMHRFILREVNPERAEVYGPVVFDHERGWLPDPEQTVHPRYVPTKWIEWVD